MALGICAAANSIHRAALPSHFAISVIDRRQEFVSRAADVGSGQCSSLEGHLYSSRRGAVARDELLEHRPEKAVAEDYPLLAVPTLGVMADGIADVDREPDPFVLGEELRNWGVW